MEFMTGVKTTDLLELAKLQNKELIGQTVKVNGAVHTIRDMGDVAFVVLRKRDGLLQCVYEEGKSGFDLKDLKEGMVLKGTVRNVIDFGAFVDIGVHQDGLVHISEMSEKFIKHPLEAVSVGDIVDVRVLGVDMKKKRISLSMKGINK